MSSRKLGTDFSNIIQNTFVWFSTQTNFQKMNTMRNTCVNISNLDLFKVTNFNKLKLNDSNCSKNEKGY